jgi:AcrR family transcriptional regulator
MPRITAPTVREHVARQERAILDAAADLFSTKGVAGTDLADIANAVGLARSSLYRYFPDKDHILAAWLSREIQPVVADVERIEADDLPAVDRIDAWINANLEWVGRSGGEVLPRLLSQIGAVSSEVRSVIAEGESRLREPLRRMVSAAVQENGQVHGVGDGASGRNGHGREEAVNGARREDSDLGDLGVVAQDPTLVSDLLLGAVDAGIGAVGRGAPVDVVCRALGEVARALLGSADLAAAPHTAA